MGHASNQMDCEVYGNYLEGLNIFEYFGQNLIMPRKSKNPILHGYSTGHSSRVSVVTY